MKRKTRFKKEFRFIVKESTITDCYNLIDTAHDIFIMQGVQKAIADEEASQLNWENHINMCKDFKKHGVKFNTF